MIGTFPARGMIGQWLKAGVVEQGRLHRTEDGVPQGGVVSPLLLNVALHGMEQAAGVRYYPTGSGAGRQCGLPGPDQIRRRSRRSLPHPAGGARGQGTARHVAGAQGSGVQRGQDARRLPRGGLRLPGVQRPPLSRQAADQAEQGGHQTDPGTAPDRAAVPAREQRPSRDQAAQPDHPGMGQLLPDTGSPARSSASSTTTCGGSPTSGPGLSHANKPKSWVFARYFGKFNKARQDRWVFGDRESGAYMHRFAWTSIVRHQIVKAAGVTRRPRPGRVLGRRRRKPVLPINNTSLRLLQGPGRMLSDLQDPALRRGPATNPKRLGDSG